MGLVKFPFWRSRSRLESLTVEGDSPVGIIWRGMIKFQSTTAWFCRGKLGGIDF